MIAEIIKYTMSKNVLSLPKGNVYLLLNPIKGDNIQIEIVGTSIIWRILYGMKIMQWLV